MKTQKNSSPTQRLALILILVILLPALFFSGYQITTITRSEELMVDLYQRQLDAILYSVNQYSLTIVQSWLEQLGGVLTLDAPGKSALAAGQIVCDRTPALVAVWMCDSTLRHPELRIMKSGADSAMYEADTIAAALEKNREKILRLKEYVRAKYRKIEPFPLPPRNGRDYLLMVFAAGPDSISQLAGLVVDQPTFIQSVITRRLEEAVSTGILREGDETPVLPTSQAATAALVQHKSLWLLPGYSIGIRFAGKSIDEIVSSRFAMNLAVIILLDVLLLVGGVLLYRNVRREVELSAMKSNFVSNVSHELRTPLALIRMYAETLEMERVTNPAKQKEYHSIIMREAERLTRLVSSILNFSRMDTGKKEYHFAALSLNDIVGQVLTLYALELKDKGFTPRLALSHVLPTVWADPEAVTEALINIIENAVKYSDKDSYLAIRTTAEGREAVVEVEDHGIGIGEQQRDRIFDMFYRVDTGSAHTTRGTGIGLALVKNIMTAHGGSVVVRSQPGIGSTFRLAFPLDHPSLRKA